MEKKAAIFLATGFEETEAVTVIDLLRRGEIQVDVLSITEELQVKGANGIIVSADALITQAPLDTYDMLILPGGMPGTLHLKQCDLLVETLKRYAEQEKWLAAICAAPTVFGDLGLLEDGIRVTCYPEFKEQLAESGALVNPDDVAKDGKFITSRSIGTVIPFALELVENLKGRPFSHQVAVDINYKQIYTLVVNPNTVHPY